MKTEDEQTQPQTSYVRSQFELLSPAAKANGWDSDEDEKSDNDSQNFDFDDDPKSPIGKFDVDDYPSLSKSESVMQMEGIKPAENQNKLLIRNKEFFDNPTRKGEEEDSDDDLEETKK